VVAVFSREQSHGFYKHLGAAPTAARSRASPVTLQFLRRWSGVPKFSSGVPKSAPRAELAAYVLIERKHSNDARGLAIYMLLTVRWARRAATLDWSCYSAAQRRGRWAAAALVAPYAQRVNWALNRAQLFLTTLPRKQSNNMYQIIFGY
jgi:hypothetical protein